MSKKIEVALMQMHSNDEIIKAMREACLKQKNECSIIKTEGMFWETAEYDDDGVYWGWPDNKASLIYRKILIQGKIYRTYRTLFRKRLMVYRRGGFGDFSVILPNTSQLHTKILFEFDFWGLDMFDEFRPAFEDMLSKMFMLLQTIEPPAH